MERRSLLKAGVVAAGTLALGPEFWRRAYGADAMAGPGPYGPLGPPDANGIRLPEGFTSRVIARGGQVVPGTSYMWHFFPDGGATFPAPDGGYAYTSNSEVPSIFGGGCSAVRFAADGTIQSAYRILGGTSTNCAGGPTPWGTWLSCEERSGGLTHECNPLEESQGVAKPALGVFTHESVATDPFDRRLYLTEDTGDGRFYRFTPARYPNLEEGLLEAAAVADIEAAAGGGSPVSWIPVDNPDEPQSENRNPDTTEFDGGEGTWFDSGFVYFTTKGDNRVWSYDTLHQRIEVIYDDDMFADGEAPLTGVDNVLVARSGDILVAEDGGDLQIVLITPDRIVAPLVQVTGQDGSELAGPAFDPSGTRLYFSSQRGGFGGLPTGLQSSGPGPGITYEVTGPFRGEARRAVSRSRARRGALIRR